MVGSLRWVSQYREQALAALESDLNEERGMALSRAGRKVETELERCNRLRLVVDGRYGPEPVAKALVDYRAARDAFETALWQFCVQREAIGLWDHTRVYRMFPSPPER